MRKNFAEFMNDCFRLLLFEFCQISIHITSKIKYFEVISSLFSFFITQFQIEQIQVFLTESVTDDDNFI